jgi:hypothetical protein
MCSKPLCVREDSVQALLGSVPLLQAPQPSEQEALATTLEVEVFESGWPIVQQGDVGAHMYHLCVVICTIRALV